MNVIFFLRDYSTILGKKDVYIDEVALCNMSQEDKRVTILGNALQSVKTFNCSFQLIVKQKYKLRAMGQFYGKIYFITTQKQVTICTHCKN